MAFKLPSFDKSTFLGIGTKIADIADSAKTNAISVAESVMNRRLEQNVDASAFAIKNSTHMKCITLGASGSGKSELLCFFSDMTMPVAESTKIQHAYPSSGETRKNYRLGSASIMFSDGLGTIVAKSARLQQIDKYIIDICVNSCSSSQIDFLCFFMVDLLSDFSDSRTIDVMKAELRVFNRRIIDKTYEIQRSREVQNIKINPKFVFVGTHLDKKTNDEDAVFNKTVARIMEKEGLAANHPYRIIAADIYSEDGRKKFLEQFLQVKEELGIN